MSEADRWEERWTVARHFIDYRCWCGRAQPPLLNEAYRRPLQSLFSFFTPSSFFVRCSAVWRFAAELARALQSHYSIALLVSILSVLYHIAPAWWGGWPFVAKGFVLIFKVVWPHGRSDLVKTACPLLLFGHLGYCQRNGPNQDLALDLPMKRHDTPPKSTSICSSRASCREVECKWQYLHLQKHLRSADIRLW